MITQIKPNNAFCFITTLYKFGEEADQFFMGMIGNINLSPPKLIEYNDGTSKLLYGRAGSIVFTKEYQEVRSLRFVHNLIKTHIKNFNVNTND